MHLIVLFSSALVGLILLSLVMLSLFGGISFWKTTPYYAWVSLIALCILYKILMRLADFRQNKEISLLTQHKIPISVLVIRYCSYIFIMAPIIFIWITGGAYLIYSYGLELLIISIILFSLYILKDFLKPWFKRL